MNLKIKANNFFNKHLTCSFKPNRNTFKKIQTMYFFLGNSALYPVKSFCLFWGSSYYKSQNSIYSNPDFFLKH